MVADVSVVIVNHNGNGFLETSVASACASAQQVIVVDNASDDDSIAMLESRAGEFPSLRIIRNDRNLGFSKACNIGIEASHREWILLLNPDARLTETSLDRLVEALRDNPGAGMAGPRLTNPDGTEQPDGRRDIPTPRKALHRALAIGPLARIAGLVGRDFSRHEHPLPDTTEPVEAISGAAMMLRRDALRDVGLLDEGYFLHCEDLDWAMRFSQAGWDILFVPDAVVIHDKGGCSHSRPVFVEWHKHRGMLRFYRKFFRDQYPLPLFWLIQCGVAVRFALSATVRSLQRLRGANHA